MSLDIKNTDYIEDILSGQTLDKWITENAELIS